MAMNPFSPFLMSGNPGFQPAQPPAQQQQRPGFGSIFGPLAMGLGAAIASNNPGAGFPIMQDARKMGLQRQQLNATAQWLERTGNSDLVPLVAAGQGAAALQMAQQRMKAKEPQSAQYGLNPLYTTDEQGNSVLFQPSNQGGARKMEFPKGIRPLGPYDKSYETSLGREVGKGAGEAQEAYASRESKMPGIRQVVAELDLLAEKGTYTYSGQAIDAVRRQMGADPSEGALARAEYIAKVNNQILPLLRDTFGAAFTEREGESLKATLGDPNASPKEKQAVLKAFIEQKERDVQALGSRIGREAPAPQSGTQGGAGVRRKYNPATGQIE